jgi:hypothetical protein
MLRLAQYNMKDSEQAPLALLSTANICIWINRLIINKEPKKNSKEMRYLAELIIDNSEQG